MAEKKLNLDIGKSVAEFEAIAKKINLSVNKKKADSVKKRDNKLPPNKKFEKRLNLREAESLLKKWKNIFNIFLIFSVFMFILIILIISFYYKTEVQRQEKIMQNGSEDYISNPIHFIPRLNDSSFYLANFTEIPEKNIQNFIIINDEKCNPNILCRYVGYMREYDLSTVVDEDFLLDKKVINCYDSSNCVSNFTYLESSTEPFSRQRIRIEKDEENKINIYDENNIFIAKLEKKDLGYIEGLYIWFKF